MTGMTRDEARAFLLELAALTERYPLARFIYTNNDDGVHIEFATDDKRLRDVDVNIGFGISKSEYLAMTDRDEMYPAICRYWECAIRSMPI